jgi:hypothetical protein
MQPRAVTHAGFNGVTESVAQIEQGALTAFPFVGGDNVGLGLAGNFNGIGQRLMIARGW